MRRSRNVAIVLAGLLAVTALPAARAAEKTISANLDSDPAPEQVAGRLLCGTTDGKLVVPQPTCSTDQFPQRRIEVTNACAGKPYTYAISSVQDFVDRLRVTEADGATARPEIFFDIRSGASGRGGEARVVRIRDEGPQGCPPGVERLWSYPSRSTLGRVPRGASGHDSWSPTLRDFSRHFKGKEIRLRETYVDRNDAFCCPSFARTTFFRFNRAKDRYVRYSTRVKRIKNR